MFVADGGTLRLAHPLRASIDLTRPNVAEEMLKRTRSAPFCLYTHGTMPLSVATRGCVLLAVREKLSQAKEIDLVDVGGEEIEMLTDRPPILLPLLESLRVHPSDFFAFTGLLVPLLQQEMPLLSVLDLCHCAIPRPLLAFPRLVVLKLAGNCETPFLMTVLETLDSLEAMPRLERIELLDALAPFEKGDLAIARRRKPIELPHPKSLSVDDNHLDGSFIIQALRYPLTAEIKIGGPTIPKTHLPAIIDICSRFRKGDAPISSLAIMFEHDFMDVHFYISDLCEHKFKESFSIELDDTGLVSTLDRPLLAICSSLPTTSITSISIDFMTLPCNWGELLQLWPNVEEVILRVFIISFFESLSTHLPKLKRLKIDSFALQTLGNSPLTTLLRHRKDINMPIESVVLDKELKVAGDTLKELERYTTLVSEY